MEARGSSRATTEVIIAMMVLSTGKTVMGTVGEDLCYKNCIAFCQGVLHAIACNLSCIQCCYHDATTLSYFDLDCLSHKYTNFKHDAKGMRSCMEGCSKLSRSGEDFYPFICQKMAVSTVVSQ